LLGETIGANFEATVARFGEREALVECTSGRRWTYRQLDDDVNALARGLLAHGIAKGDRVGIWSPNGAEWVLVQYATAKVGAILVNVNPAYRAHELTYALNQSGVSLLVTAQANDRSDYPAMASAARAECAAMTDVVVISTPSWDSLVAGGDAVAPERLTERAATLSFDDPINIQYTSGTTGFPKGATLSHHNILNNGYFVGELVGYSENDRVCLPVPFYHCFGMVMGNLGATTHGSCIVIPAPSFDAGATLDAVAAERCTSLYGVPTMFIAELNHPSLASLDLSCLRTGIMLRHDRNVPGVDPDPHGRRPRAPNLHGRTSDAAPRDQSRRPSQRPHRASRRTGRAVHSRLLGDARLLGQRGCDGRGY
jgi:fatty-acyl-CoA synthase